MAVVAMALVSCASVPQKLDPEVFYKRDMLLSVNGFEGSGALVVPRGTEYKIEIEAKGNLDLLTVESCHREDSVEGAGEGGIFGNRKRAKRTYRPIAGLEVDDGACPLRFGGYERQKGRHSWAYLDIEDPQTTLPALVHCNGSEYNSRGVTVCQAKAGLIQEIIFPVPTIVIGSDECPMPRPSDLKSYRFTMPPKECIFRWREVAPPHRDHRLTTIGYGSILVRDN